MLRNEAKQASLQRMGGHERHCLSVLMAPIVEARYAGLTEPIVLTRDYLGQRPAP
jgi:hypothetical protein